MFQIGEKFTNNISARKVTPVTLGSTWATTETFEQALLKTVSLRMQGCWHTHKLSIDGGGEERRVSKVK